MKNIIPECFNERLEKVQELDNLFSGLRMNPEFCLPDNILIFYHTWTEPVPNMHGRCTIVVPLDEMIYYVEREKIIMRPGEVLFIPPYAQRFLHPDSKGYRRFFITFELHHVAYYAKHFGLSRLTERSWESLLKFIDIFLAQKANESSLCIIDFLNTLDKRHQETKYNIVLDAKLALALSYVQTHLDYIGNMSDIAKHCKISESHLRNLFKSEFGISLGKYVAQQRFDAAKYMLKHTKSTINEIAMKTGFSNQFVFSSFFKRKTGMSPSQFRNSSSTNP